MTEEIANEISCDVLGMFLLLPFFSDVLQTTIGSALLMNHFSRLTNCHYMKLTYLYTITIYP
jgi:di/tricarboxylate transporter